MAKKKKAAPVRRKRSKKAEPVIPDGPSELEGWKVGDMFELYGEKYRLEGYNPKARKFPIQLTRLSDNSKRKAQESMLRSGKKVEVNG